MKFFTPDRYVALQKLDVAGMDAADADWDEAAEQYESYLTSIRPRLPETIRQLVESYYWHDAEVLSISRRDKALVLLVQMDVPPRDLVVLTYTLNSEAAFSTGVIPPEYCTAGMQWLHDELELHDDEGPKRFRHSILFSNGWEVRIPFDDVQIIAMQPVYSVSRSGNRTAFERIAV